MRKRELKYIPTAIQMYFKEIDFVKLYERYGEVLPNAKCALHGMLSCAALRYR